MLPMVGGDVFNFVLMPMLVGGDAFNFRPRFLFHSFTAADDDSPPPTCRGVLRSCGGRLSSRGLQEPLLVRRSRSSGMVY